MRLIDVDKLMQRIKKKLCISSFAYLMDSEKAIINVIESEPSIEMPTWIPCSERLPEDSGQYLVTEGIEQRQAVIGYYSAEYGHWYAVSDVSAWIPLPEPWKGADDEHL